MAIEKGMFFDTMDPFFSICIPVYKPTDDFYDCIASIAKQTFKDYEVLLLDDGTPIAVNFENYLSQAGVCISKTRVSRVDNGGPYRSRILLAQLARGRYVVTMDADDAFIDESVLSRLYEEIERFDSDIVIFNYSRSNNIVAPCIDYRGLNLHDGLVDLSCYKRLFATTYELNSLWSKVVKRSLFDGLKEPKQFVSMGEDRLMTLNILLKARSIALIDEPLYYYRVAAESVTSSPYTIEKFRQLCLVERCVLDSLDKLGGSKIAWATNYLTVTSNALLAMVYGNNYSLKELFLIFAEMRELEPCAYAIRQISSCELRGFRLIQLNLFAKQRYRALYSLMNVRRIAVSLASLCGRIERIVKG